MPGREGEQRYRRFPAPAAVAGYVDHVWMLDDPPARPELQLPSARPSIVVGLAGSGVRRDPLADASWPAVDAVVGLTTRPYLVEYTPGSSMVGARLTSWGLAALFPRDRMVDEALGLGRWLGADALAQLSRRIGAAEFGHARAEALTDVLLTLLTPVEPRTLKLLHRLVTAVHRTGGHVPVARLATELGVSASTLYRLCHGSIGLPPRQYCELVRFQRFTGGLFGELDDPARMVTALRTYYEQGHAAADFKRDTGVSQATFRRITRGLDRLLHAG